MFVLNCESVSTAIPCKGFSTKYKKEHSVIQIYQITYQNKGIVCKNVL